MMFANRMAVRSKGKSLEPLLEEGPPSSGSTANAAAMSCYRDHVARGVGWPRDDARHRSSGGGDRWRQPDCDPSSKRTGSQFGVQIVVLAGERIEPPTRTIGSGSAVCHLASDPVKQAATKISDRLALAQFSNVEEASAKEPQPSHRPTDDTEDKSEAASSTRRLAASRAPRHVGFLIHRTFNCPVFC